ncbi:hypothetical protein IAQ61_003092 [Plenodomus lingam]|uniref:Predicted protein n=1 Tax=Leptosphaeria maculans (strain JN3 / isolate v23.1.3 / race Av1-4-5-6-7-8) TaxID=985895 RepID=E5ADI3_LEPMJ|nr:predicted protein [Plenodomus lingam JN3]KAH9875628.1 hypothetical protein IAQ61_003092 [Plenodomus lingam]CBY01272.1 predicted protein [Plenodomus lingam JN3]
MPSVTRQPFGGNTPQQHALIGKPQNDIAAKRQDPKQTLCSTLKSLLNLVLQLSIGWERSILRPIT